MKSKFTMKHFLIITFIIALVLGVTGFLVSGMEFSNALFYTLIMYVMNFTDEPDNLLINIARYIAALFTLSAVVTFFLKIVGATTDLIRSWQKDSTFVFGKGCFADSFCKTAKCPQIRRDTFFNAKRYVLLDEKDEDNLAFYVENQDELADKIVYAKIGEFSNTIAMNGRHFFFSIEEMIARKYWQEQDLISEAFLNGELTNKISVVIPFWGRQAEQLVYYGIQNNVFDANQTVEYQIFGCSEEFIFNHKNLQILNICAHTEPWYKASVDVFREATRVVICDADDKFSEISKVIACMDSGRIDLLCRMNIPKSLLESASCNATEFGDVIFNVYNWTSTICNESILMGDWLEKAKKLNEAYTSDEDKVNKSADDLWSSLNSFLRYSNLFAVEYHTMRKKILAARKISIQQAIQDNNEFDKMGELEHIRWCNYHLYNNWSCWECEKIEKPLKNPGKRLHKDLVPYANLPESEKDKDKANITKLEELYQ